MKKLLFTSIIVLSLTLSSCTNATSEPSITMAATETTTEVNEPTTEAEMTTAPPETTLALPTLLDNFNTLLTQDTHAGDLGLFIRENIGDASPEEAEFMLKWLLIYQSELILKINDVIFTEAYANPLHQDMGGMINPELINNIQDVEIRADYQALVDGFMTLVRYEETPVIETDWKALSTLKDAFDVDMSDFLELRGDAHFNGSTSYYEMAERVVIVENMIEDTNDSYLKLHLNKLHTNLVYDVLIGPEGSHMAVFVGKSGPVYKELMIFAEDFPDSSFGQLIYELDHNEWQDFSGPSNLTDWYVAFGYGGDYYWSTETISTEAIQGEKLTLITDYYPEIAGKVNMTMNKALNDLASETNGSYGYNMMPFYSSNSYVSLYISLRYLATPDQTKYIETTLTFDLSTGELISLSDYLGITDEEARVFANKEGHTNFTMMPHFYPSANGILLTPAFGETAESRWGMIPTKALIPYLDLEALIR